MSEKQFHYIKQVANWTEIPQELPIKQSFEEVEGTLREMKQVLASCIKPPRGFDTRWYAESIWRIKRDYPLGVWFFDSLIAVNHLLKREAATGNFRTLYANVGQFPNASRLARITAECYQYPDKILSWRLYLYFYKDIDDRSLLDGPYDVSEMIESGWWPSIVRNFGLLPGKYADESEWERARATMGL
jgi:hypothetical protein